jgi:hypothetical protein
MTNVMMVRATVTDESVADVEAAAKEMFAAIDAAQPSGVHYASLRVGGGATFVVLLALDEGVDNPLPAIAEFRAFQQGLQGWLAEPSAMEQATVVGSYGLF